MSGDLGSYRRAQEARRALLNRGSRYWLDDGSEDAAVSQHEAAHALTGLLLGLDVTAVTVEPGARFGGMTTWASKPDRAFETIVALVAGNESEKLFGGGSDNGCKNDLAQARALARSISDDEIGDTIKRARRAARSILKANLLPLTKLAVALIDKRTLLRGEIEEIVAANAPDDDASDGGDDDAELLAPSIFDRDPILMRMLSPRLVHYGTTGEIL
jgi:ATP-dependent Zn protease